MCFRFIKKILLAMVLYMASTCLFAQKTCYTNEMLELIKKTKLKPEFRNYKPNFSVLKKDIAFRGPSGTYHEEKWFIMDGKKYIAVYSPGEKPSFDFIAASPYLAKDSLKMPVRHHNSTLWGTRLTSSIWYDKWAISGDNHAFEFKGGGDSLVFIESQSWSPESFYKRNGKSVHRFTFRCDPYFGYIITINCLLETDDTTKRTPEFINFMPPDVTNPWPDKNRFAYTIYSENDKQGSSGYTRFANNLAAGNLSDEEKQNWGKGFSIRSGGFVAMADDGAWSPALFRSGNYLFAQRTCDVWLDQHNIVHFPPKPDTDGFYRVRPQYVFLHFPPQLSSYLIKNSKERTFRIPSQVMLRLGITEDFEDQPLSLSYTNAALTKGFWEKDFQISTETAHSGNKSLVLEGVPPKKGNEPVGEFIHCPAIPLEPNTTYRISAFAKVEGDSVRAYISADFYEWTASEKSRLRWQKTNQASQNRWQQIDLLFTTPDYDPFVDLRFNVTGKGRGWFDDFRFEKIPDPKWTLADTIMDMEKPIPFRMWVAPGTKHVKGLILATRVSAEEDFVINPAIRKVAAEENLAIIKTDGRAFAMFDPQKGEDLLFMRILKKCALKSGFKEIEDAPWLTFGHSTAGHFAKNLAFWKPERTFGIIYFKSGQFHAPVWAAPNASLKNVPIIFVSGQFEEFGPHGPLQPGENNESQWKAVRDTLMVLRQSGYLASMIVEPGEGHFCLSQKVADYLALFIKKAARAKIPEKANLPLKEIRESSGVLSDTCCSALIENSLKYPDKVLMPFGQNPAPQKAFWHLDKEMASAWLTFYQENKTKP